MIGGLFSAVEAVSNVTVLYRIALEKFWNRHDLTHKPSNYSSVVVFIQSFSLDCFEIRPIRDSLCKWN